MPRSLRRQLVKSSRKAFVKAQQPLSRHPVGEGGESLVSSDSECPTGVMPLAWHVALEQQNTEHIYCSIVCLLSL